MTQTRHTIGGHWTAMRTAEKHRENVVEVAAMILGAMMMALPILMLFNPAEFALESLVGGLVVFLYGFGLFFVAGATFLAR